MSYVRWGPDSAVYVFWHYNRDLICCNCCMEDIDGDFEAGEDPHLMVAHMKAHRAAGHKVPDYMIDDFVEMIEGEPE